VVSRTHWGKNARTKLARRATFSPAAAAGNCHFRSSPEKKSKREAGIELSFPREWRKPVTGKSLLGKYENALLSLKAEFDQLAIGVRDDAVEVRPGVAVFPATLSFGDLLVAIQNRQVITVDEEAVVASLDFGLAHLHGVRNRKSGGDGLRENRHGESATENQSREERIAFHELILSTFESTGSVSPGGKS
jgi:hypothetical protein